MARATRDTNNIGPMGDDSRRDLGAKGGPATGMGLPDDKHGISEPYNESTQTKIAVKSKGKSKKAKQQKDK